MVSCGARLFLTVPVESVVTCSFAVLATLSLCYCWKVSDVWISLKVRRSYSWESSRFFRSLSKRLFIAVRCSSDRYLRDLLKRMLNLHPRVRRSIEVKGASRGAVLIGIQNQEFKSSTSNNLKRRRSWDQRKLGIENQNQELVESILFTSSAGDF
jgi:hypothetical protein